MISHHQYGDSALTLCTYLQCLTSVDLSSSAITSFGVTSLILGAPALLKLRSKVSHIFRPPQLSHLQPNRRTNMTHITLEQLDLRITYSFVIWIVDHCPKLKYFGHSAALSTLEFVSIIKQLKHLESLCIVFPNMQVEASCYSAITENCKFLSKLSFVYLSTADHELDLNDLALILEKWSFLKLLTVKKYVIPLSEHSKQNLVQRFTKYSRNVMVLEKSKTVFYYFLPKHYVDSVYMQREGWWANFKEKLFEQKWNILIIFMCVGVVL